MNTIIRFGNRWKPTEYINIQAGHVMAGPIQPGWLSAQWEIEPVPGTSFVRFKNVWKPDQHLHIQQAIPEAGPIEPGWLSARWEFETVPDTVYVRIRNCWNLVRYAHIQTGEIDIGQVEPGWHSAQWLLEKVVQNTSFVRLRNRWHSDQCLNIQSGTLSAGPVQPGWLSAQWSVEKISGTPYIRLKNCWKPDQYFHIQNGKAEAGPIQPGWLSAQWLLEPVEGTNFVRLRNRWEIERYLHIEGGVLEIGAIQPGWLSAQWLKADPAMGVRGIPEILFQFGAHNLSFSNFDDGVPDSGTFRETFGTGEVLYELTISHPILTAAFFLFYKDFLKGTDNGGLATGFCTSLASLVADNFWTGRTDTHTITKASVHKFLTAVHGKLLSRESILHFHDQGLEGIARVERTCREVEATFLRGPNRNNQPLIFFIPSGEVWDGGYIDKLNLSHCVMPYRFQYPPGHPGPQLSPDGKTTVTDLDNVELFVWNCNQPECDKSRIIFTNKGGQIEYEFSSDPRLNSQNGFTLGMMTNGDYLLADHDLPFSGPLGLKRFIIDFLLSPADLQITDGNGLHTGNFDGKIRSEIPGSHPVYLVPGAYLLPADTNLTRRIMGAGTGTYTFNSITPDGSSVVLHDVATALGQVDELSLNPDQTQLRFTPGAEMTFNLTVARRVGDQARAITIRGVGGSPAADMAITTSRELSFVRFGNPAIAHNVQVQAFLFDQKNNKTLDKQLAVVNVPSKNDLHVNIQNWDTLTADVQMLQPK